MRGHRWTPNTAGFYFFRFANGASLYSPPFKSLLCMSVVSSDPRSLRGAGSCVVKCMPGSYLKTRQSVPDTRGCSAASRLHGKLLEGSEREARRFGRISVARTMVPAPTVFGTGCIRACGELGVSLDFKAGDAPPLQCTDQCDSSRWIPCAPDWKSCRLAPNSRHHGGTSSHHDACHRGHH